MKKPQHKSARADGRGGWTPGKRRNQDVGDWQRIRITLASLLNDRPEAGRVSVRSIARVIGVADRTLRRWLSGEDRPAPAAQEMLRQWLTELPKKA